MNEQNFKRAILASAAVFLAVFLFYTLPAAIEQADLIQSFALGFVNPLATGYSVDVIACGFIFFFWVLFEAKQYGVRYGWICIPLSFIPGVAVAFALYLLIRHKQLTTTLISQTNEA